MTEHSKDYIKKLPNNTELNIKISVEIKNFNKNDYRDMFGSFAQCSRDFYLKELKSIVNAD